MGNGERILLLLFSCGALLSCSEDSAEPPFVPPGPGLVFSFPDDGQLDVPTGARVSVGFSEAIDQGQISSSCSVSGAGVSGGLCLVGPMGPVAGSWTVVGEGGRGAEFVADDELPSGAQFAVHISPSILAAGVGNATAEAPAFEFTTRQDRSKVATAAEVVAINGEPALVFEPGSGLEPRFPLVDFATYRLVFSEPIDERTAVLGSSIEFVELPAGGAAEVPVAGQLLVQGIHLSFDPDADLNPASTYSLRVNPSLLDLGGEPARAQIYQFRPESSHASGELYSQVLDVASGLGDEDFPRASTVSSLARNHISVNTALIGENVVELKDGLIQAEMAHPSQFETSVPIVIRKGQSVETSGLDVALAGVVDSGLSTGDLRLTFISDVTGVMVRNQYWPSDVIPDNQEAPLHVVLTFDIGVTAVDPIGNAVLTQTVLGAQATGLAEVVDGQLLITSVATLNLDVLGIAKAPTRVALAFATTVGQSVSADLTPPGLVGSYPEPGRELLEAGDSVLLIFSEAVELRDADAIELRTTSGASLTADARVSGSMVVITPSQTLLEDRDFRVFIGAGVTDLTGNTWATEASDPTGGQSVLEFSTGRLSASSPLPPALMTVYPGAPCALVGNSSGSRRCQGGEPDDEDYRPFELPGNHNIDVLFDQPMNRDSVTLGTACGEGSFRVEEMSGSSCQAAVPGTLLVGERSIRFLPERDWSPGQEYRIRLVGGSNATCGTGELCGSNEQPLNTNPLASASEPGGPDVQIFFTGTETSKEHVVVTTAQPIVDRNGNGQIDVGENRVDTNRAAVRLAGVSGVVTSATIDMEDCDSNTPSTEGCMFMSSDLVVRLGEKLDDCVINTATETVNADHCIPATVTPTAIYGTELNMDASVLGLGLINDLTTGKVVLRVRQSNGPIRGYIVEDEGGAPEMLITLSTYMDAPDLSILGGLADHDLKSKELRVSLRGPVNFRDDGRLEIALQNEDRVTVEVGVTTLGLETGTMTLTIEPGAMVLALMSDSARGGQR